MTVNTTDIQYVLSGGTYNSDPNLSLGGDPSLQVIWGTNNNLFDDVLPLEAEEGSTDYRCLYVVNNNATDTFYDTRIYIEEEVTGGSDVEIGIIQTTDLQQLIVSGISEGGSITLKYENSNVVMNWNLILSQWAKNLQDALNALSDLGGVVVTASEYRNSGSTRDMTRVFEISFAGASNYRYHPILTLVSNDIVGSPTVQLVKLQNGSPINSIAAEIDTDTIEPYGVTWSYPTIDDTLIIGNLHGGDSFPLWVKRETAAGAAPKSSDGFTMRVMGRPFE